jgi:AcrR family transcriptional regulator
MARTQEQRKAETRTRLLDAAAELFGSRGFDAVSTDAVADAADRTSGAVYAHFGGKPGLLLALLEERSLTTGRAIKRALAETDDPADPMATVWRAFTEAADRDESWMLLEHELWLYAARHPEARAALARRYAGARAAMGEAFAAWSATGRDGPDRDPVEPTGAAGRTPAATATLVLALLLGLEMQRHLDPASVPDDLAEDGLRALLGHHPPAPPAPRKERSRAH